MYFLTVLGILSLSLQPGHVIQTKHFMANENRQGYDEKLMVQTISKHFPDVNVDDRKALAEIVSTEKGQLVLRNAAVKEMKKKIESQKRRKKLDEPLDDDSYCNYVWLSWLPWLSCPHTAKQITPLRYYQNMC